MNKVTSEELKTLKDELSTEEEIVLATLDELSNNKGDDEDE